MNELITSTDFVLDSLMNQTTFEQLQRSATLYSKSGLVPKSFENNTAACFIGLQLACSLGVNPFMLFQGLYNIGGKIGIETKVAVAIANQKGIFQGPITHEFKGEKTNRSCTAKAVLAKSGKEVSITVDWATVESEGWNKRSGSKWLTMPDQMFRYRSSMWLIRTYSPEVLMGLSAIDEIEDSRVIDVTPKKVKNIDEALADVAKAEKPAKEATPVVDVPSSLKNIKEVDRGTGALVGEPLADVVTVEPQPVDDKKALIDQILAYGIKPNIMAVYIVKAVGANKPLAELTKEELEKVLAHVAKTKGAK